MSEKMTANSQPTMPLYRRPCELTQDGNYHDFRGRVAWVVYAMRRDSRNGSLDVEAALAELEALLIGDVAGVLGLTGGDLVDWVLSARMTPER
jgi:hypothetical protein